MSSLSSIWATMKTTVLYLFKVSSARKETTEEYPDRLSARTAEDLPGKSRGMLYNDIQKCSGCRFCSDVCPVDCIYIETEQGPEKNTSWVAVFDIDNSRCVFCGLCVEACPTKSLQHTRQYEGSVYKLESMIYSFGKGFATKEMRTRWQAQQVAKDAMAEEYARLEESPVGAELRRWKKKDE